MRENIPSESTLGYTEVRETKAGPFSPQIFPWQAAKDCASSGALYPVSLAEKRKNYEAAGSEPQSQFHYCEDLLGIPQDSMFLRKTNPFAVRQGTELGKGLHEGAQPRTQEIHRTHST